MACVALGCKSRLGRLSALPAGRIGLLCENKRISFHRFPKDPDLKEKWIRNMKRRDWTPSQYSRLCSLHFDESCYRTGYQLKILHSDAVPTIFPETSKYAAKKFVRRSRPSRVEILSPSNNIANEVDIEILNGIVNEQRKIIRKLQLRIQHFKMISAKRRRALKNVQQKNYITSKKLANITNIVNGLITKEQMDKEKIEILAGNNNVLKRDALKGSNIGTIVLS